MYIVLLQALIFQPAKRARHIATLWATFGRSLQRDSTEHSVHVSSEYSLFSLQTDFDVNTIACIHFSTSVGLIGIYTPVGSVLQ